MYHTGQGSWTTLPLHRDKSTPFVEKASLSSSLSTVGSLPPPSSLQRCQIWMGKNEALVLHTGGGRRTKKTLFHYRPQSATSQGGPLPTLSPSQSTHTCHANGVVRFCHPSKHTATLCPTRGGVDHEISHTRSSTAIPPRPTPQVHDNRSHLIGGTAHNTQHTRLPLVPLATGAGARRMFYITNILHRAEGA